MWNLHRERASPPQDTTPPETTIDSRPSGTVKQNNASFTFSSEAGGTEFVLLAEVPPELDLDLFEARGNRAMNRCLSNPIDH